MWNLPDGAIARFGKGGISQGDRVIAFSPDGGLLALATTIGVWLYDVETTRELVLLPGESRWSHALAFSPDGATLASGSPSSCGMSKPENMSLRFKDIRDCLGLSRFLPMAQRLPQGRWIKRLNFGRFRPGKILLPSQGTRMRSNLWHSRPTARNWLRGLRIKMLNFGMFQQGKKSPHSRGTLIGSGRWHFHLMARQPLRRDWEINPLSCGKFRQERTSLHFRDIQVGVGSPPWRFHLMVQYLPRGRVMTPLNCGRFRRGQTSPRSEETIIGSAI